MSARKHVAKPVTSKGAEPGRWVYCDACGTVKRTKAAWHPAKCRGPRKRASRYLGE
ncbi:MAG: hypothetical protein QG586_388 [Pseudomonadota bacterium]|nr:hypothetical protein [Pseudomonadota bacterium]MDQ1344858.1 hypothetical protein [Pseudomonadota bacterium]